MPRVVVLGCGTGVGKTYLSTSLLRRLGAIETNATIGLKPVESGLLGYTTGDSPPRGSDAELLARASTASPTGQHPLYALRDPISPHLAARRQGIEIELSSIRRWVVSAESELALRISPHRSIWSVVETAGGVFSPLSARANNFDLALALDPAIWVLVAANALGVLHEVSVTVQAMRARGRLPDHIVLNAASEPDASTGSNADELSALAIATPSAVLERNDDGAVSAFAQRLMQDAQKEP